MIIKIPFSPSRLDSTEFLDRFLKNYFAKKKDVNIADIGCGRLFFYSILLNYKIKGSYYGLDISPFRDVRDHPTLKTTVVKKDFLTAKFNENFNLVTSFWVLEHIKDDKRAFTKLGQLVTKDGYLIVAVPSIYSWLIEFGRHGFHYYTKSKILKWAKDNNLKTEIIYESSGLLGLIFMLVYSWPRLMLLPLLVGIFLMLKKIRLEKRSWKEFSSDIIGKVFYSYHRNQKLLKVHNDIISSLVFFDNKFKILPSSYIFVLRK